FFFSSRRRHTGSDRDWSSGVCSSDLGERGRGTRGGGGGPADRLPGPARGGQEKDAGDRLPAPAPYRRRDLVRGFLSPMAPSQGKIGRASCRERVQRSMAAVSVKERIR